MENLSDSRQYYMQLMDKDPAELTEMGVPDDVRRRVLRLRAAYAHWIDHPRDSQAQMVAWLCGAGGLNPDPVARSQAYRDMALLRQIVGSVQQLSKDFARWRFDQMVEQAFDLAVEKEDPKGMASAAAAFAKYHKLDQEDEKVFDPRSVTIQQIVLTDDPRTAGVKPIANVMQHIKRLQKKYGDEDMRMVQAEMEDMISDAATVS